MLVVKLVQNVVQRIRNFNYQIENGRSECGVVHDRDKNAAINLMKYGQSIVTAL